MATLSFDIPNQLITVDLPDTEVTIQEIWDQTATMLDDFRMMTIPNFMFAGGKDDLGGGLLTAITLTLVDWMITFADRAGPSTVSTEINGGNLVGKIGSITGLSQDPITPAAFTFIKIARSTDSSLLDASSQLTRITEVWQRLGLDSANDVTITDNSITFDGITITITQPDTDTTVTSRS